MKLTTKGRYAVTAMLDLALHEHQRPVSLADVAVRQDISLSYLEQLFAKLRSRDLVKSTRGPGGGYQLAKAPSEIAIAEIILAVDEGVDATGCRPQGECAEAERCLTHDLWAALSEQIRGFLSDINLENLMQRRAVLEVAMRQEETVVTLQR